MPHPHDVPPNVSPTDLSLDLPGDELPRGRHVATAGRASSRPARTDAEAAPAVADYPRAFRLLTKQDVCAVYDISVRCLENWINQGLVPKPVHIGGRRYWHPERFYAEVAAMTGAGRGPAALGMPPVTADDGASAEPPGRRRRPGKPVEPLACAVSSVQRSNDTCDQVKRRLGLA